MIVVLSDHNVEGQAQLLIATLVPDGWLEAYPLLIVTFNDVGLPVDSSDRDVWRFCQENQMVLLTSNRNRKGENSLQQTIDDENTETSLPVLTIGNLDRMDENQYRKIAD